MSKVKISSDLYRTALKSDGSWQDECVCRECAVKIDSDKNSKLKVYYDIHATRSFDGEEDEYGNTRGDEGFNEDYAVEICPLCESHIPRGEKNWIKFEIPEGIKRS